MKIRGGRSMEKIESCSSEMQQQVAGESRTSSTSETTTEESSKTDKVSGSDSWFKCKTCNKTFPSFQALGGHRTSHRKKKAVSLEPCNKRPVKAKVHSCVICGAEFSMGQSLGGHMRKHRVLAMNGAQNHESSSSTMSSESEAIPGVNRREPLGFDLNLAASDTEEEM